MKELCVRTFDVILLLWYFSVVNSQTQSQTFSVEEETKVGTFIGTLGTADIQAPFTHILPLEAQKVFEVNLDTGLILTKTRLDREHKDIYRFFVVSNGNKQLQVEVRVLDINDNAPMFSQLVYNVTVKDDAQVGLPIVRVTAKDPDEGLGGSISYSLILDHEDVGGYFVVDSMTGTISISKMLMFHASDVTLPVTAADSGTPSYQSHANVIVLVRHVMKQS